MTYEEAIEILLQDYYSPDTSDAVEVAIEALEKQIPKKPVATEHFFRGCCPCCEEYIVTEYSFPKHCENCGQALDWSEEE